MNPVQRPDNLADGNGGRVSDQLLKAAHAANEILLNGLDSRLEVLIQKEADVRLMDYGMNEMDREKD